MLPAVPTTRQSLIAAGWSSSQLDAKLRSARLASPFRGVLAEPVHLAGVLGRVKAALLTQHPNAIAAMQTAAVLRRFRWLPESWAVANATVHLAVGQNDAHRQRAGMRLHHRLLTADDVTVVQGIPCMSATRTLVELARDPTLNELLVVQIIDGALRDGHSSRAELLACLSRFPGERYVARARRLVNRSREGVDSPPETTIRLILEDEDIHVEPGLEICDDDGLVLARADLGIRRYLLWGEYDGFDPHSKKPVFRGDRVGDRWLHRRGWHTMRFVDIDLQRPDRIRAEWRQAIADAPLRIAALDPRRSPEIAVAQQMLGVGPAAA